MDGRLRFYPGVDLGDQNGYGKAISPCQMIWNTEFLCVLTFRKQSCCGGVDVAFLCTHREEIENDVGHYTDLEYSSMTRCHDGESESDVGDHNHKAVQCQRVKRSCHGIFYQETEADVHNRTAIAAGMMSEQSRIAVAAVNSQRKLTWSSKSNLIPEIKWASFAPYAFNNPQVAFSS